jgi:hypothetical protein
MLTVIMRLRHRLIALTVGLALVAAAVMATRAPAGGRPVTAGRHAAGHAAAGTPHLLPQSVSFVSASTGWVWGPTAWPAAGRAEPGVLARTDDGGHTWHPVPIPAGIDFADPWRGGVQGVHFLDRRHGYLYGSELWYTADGGRRWRRAHLTGAVLDIRGHFALVMPCAGPRPCAAAVLDRLAGPQLRRVLPAAVSEYASFAVHGASAYLASPGDTVLWASGDDGRTWHRMGAPCPGARTAAVALAAWSRSGLAVACGGEPGAGQQAKTFALSTDGGRTWSQRSARPMSAGYVGSLAALDRRTWVFAQVRFPMLEVSHDGGRTWTAPRSTGFSGEWWGSLSFFGQGELVAAPATLNGTALLFGADGARRWRAARFTPSALPDREPERQPEPARAGRPGHPEALGALRPL